MICRFDKQPIHKVFIDLGYSPPSNAFLANEQLDKPEVHYPLRLYVSERTFLVQTEDFARANDIFSEDYIYFSSYSKSWLKHAEEYVEKVITRLDLDTQNFVVEIASNDGYLLQNFQPRHIPCLGIEPTQGTADAARNKGIETWVKFFGEETAQQLKREKGCADLLIGNNVLAHVPDINNFVAGLKIALNSTGTITMEFPHLMELVKHCQFDTIYHEHFSYLSLYTVIKIFKEHGLDIYDVEQLTTHGGSLRIYAQHEYSGPHSIHQRVDNLLQVEAQAGMHSLDFYEGFQKAADKIKNDILEFLITQHKAGKKVVGYGAAAKGNTLLNYAGIRPDLLPYIADASLQKQGKFTPGTHIPVVASDRILKDKPDYVLILPWNLKIEIMQDLRAIREWGGKFIIPIPQLQVV